MFVGVSGDAQAGLDHLLGFYRHPRRLKALQSRFVGWIKVSRPPYRQLFSTQAVSDGIEKQLRRRGTLLWARCCGRAKSTVFADLVGSIARPVHLMSVDDSSPFKKQRMIA